MGLWGKHRPKHKKHKLGQMRSKIGQMLFWSNQVWPNSAMTFRVYVLGLGFMVFDITCCCCSHQRIVQITPTSVSLSNCAYHETMFAHLRKKDVRAMKKQIHEDVRFCSAVASMRHFTIGFTWASWSCNHKSQS